MVLEGVQHSTMSFSLTRKMENCISKGKVFEVLLTDLSKEFDCLNH